MLIRSIKNYGWVRASVASCDVVGLAAGYLPMGVKRTHQSREGAPIQCAVQAPALQGEPGKRTAASEHTVVRPPPSKMPPKHGKKKINPRTDSSEYAFTSSLLPNTSLQRSFGRANHPVHPLDIIPWGSSGQVGKGGLRKFLWGCSHMGVVPNGA
ncbi:hypothetical protein CDAR_512291 [Caerostris darwini]|uniref:Uncharacterized protein n=1 Tax=Caerostris darwini TaxID=1538125 RepID=A0AAV4WHV8_9ARAC|nr:hypothetical protein CDAR_512291 [Caerostris darwini]